MVKQTVGMLKVAKPVVLLDDALNAMFEIYDLDKSGCITVDEMVILDKVFSEAGQAPFKEEETRSNFTESDANKDSKVSLAEYTAYFKATAGKTGMSEESLLGLVKQTNEILI